MEGPSRPQASHQGEIRDSDGEIYKYSGCHREASGVANILSLTRVCRSCCQGNGPRRDEGNTSFCNKDPTPCIRAYFEPRRYRML